MATPCARLQFVRGPVRNGSGGRPFNGIVRRQRKISVTNSNIALYNSQPLLKGHSQSEVCHAYQRQTPRPVLVSRPRVNAGRDSLPKLESNAVIASSAGRRNSSRSSVETIRARANPAAGFKHCCMLTGNFDGSDRHHFFQKVKLPSNKSLERTVKSRGVQLGRPDDGTTQLHETASWPAVQRNR